MDNPRIDRHRVCFRGVFLYQCCDCKGARSAAKDLTVWEIGVLIRVGNLELWEICELPLFSGFGVAY